MNRELQIIVKTINRLSLIYWHPSSGFQDKERIRLLMGDWRKAFRWFLTSYAFERQGRSPHYSSIAAKALQLYDREIPGQDFETNMWLNFLRSGDFPANGKGTNKDRNPLQPSDNTHDSATQLIISLEEYDFNIVQWACSLTGSGDIRTPWNRLVQIRGIGRKIASLFLRDIVDAFEIEENRIEKPEYLQPIDIWTERGAKALAQLEAKTPKSYWEFAELLVEVSSRAKVRSTLTNTGLWLLGSQLVGDPVRLHDLLLNGDNLCGFLAEEIDRLQNRAKILKSALSSEALRGVLK